MKKFVRLTALLLAAAMMLALSACGGSSSAGSSGTLTMQIWDTAQRDGMQALADAYHEKNPDITVEIQVTSWDEYWTKLEAAATSNTLPDVFWMHTNYILQYADNGMLADLTDLYSGEKRELYTLDTDDPDFPDIRYTGKRIRLTLDGLIEQLQRIGEHLLKRKSGGFGFTQGAERFRQQIFQSADGVFGLIGGFRQGVFPFRHRIQIGRRLLNLRHQRLAHRRRPPERRCVRGGV